MYTGSKEDANDGEWVPVDPISGALTINAGDMLQVWSNGRVKAAEHRVRASKAGGERHSIAFFLNPGYEANIHPQQLRANERMKYRSMNWGAFRALRFQGDYSDSGEEVQIEHFRSQS